MANNEYDFQLTDGTISAFRDGWRYSFYYTCPIDKDRKRVFKYCTSKAKREAKTERSELQDQVEVALKEKYSDHFTGAGSNGEADASFSGSLTFSQYYNRFEDIRYKTNAVEKRTISGNRSALKRIAAHSDICEKKMEEITEDDLENLHVSLASSFQPRTVKNTMQVVKQLFNHASVRRLISYNPCLVLKPTRIPKTSVRALSDDERLQFIEIIESANHSPLIICCYILLLTGMRSGEACALRWRDIDFQRRQEIYIGNLISRDDTGKEFLKEYTKNEEDRYAPLVNELAQVLLEWKTQFPEKCDDYYVLGSPENSSKWYSPVGFGRAFKTLFADTYGLSIQGHMLRHTFASKLLADGVDVLTVASIIGHKDVSMTLNTYGTPDSNARKLAMGSMSKLLIDEKDYFTYPLTVSDSDVITCLAKKENIDEYLVNLVKRDLSTQ